MKDRANRAGTAAIYVNDNFGKWQEDFKTMAEHFQRDEAKGKQVVRLLQPGPDDYYEVLLRGANCGVPLAIGLYWLLDQTPTLPTASSAKTLASS